MSNPMKSPPVSGNLGRGPINLVSEPYDPHFGAYGSPISSSSSHGVQRCSSEEQRRPEEPRYGWGSPHYGYGWGSHLRSSTPAMESQPPPPPPEHDPYCYQLSSHQQWQYSPPEQPPQTSISSWSSRQGFPEDPRHQIVEESLRSLEAMEPPPPGPDYGYPPVMTAPFLAQFQQHISPPQQYEASQSLSQPPEQQCQSLQQHEEIELKVLDEMPVRKLGSTSWCRRCKIECESMEGLVIHSLTSEHQNNTMTLVTKIKQNIPSTTKYARAAATKSVQASNVDVAITHITSEEDSKLNVASTKLEPAKPNQEAVLLNLKDDVVSVEDPANRLALFLFSEGGQPATAAGNGSWEDSWFGDEHNMKPSLVEDIRDVTAAALSSRSNTYEGVEDLVHTENGLTGLSINPDSSLTITVSYPWAIARSRDHKIIIWNPGISLFMFLQVSDSSEYQVQSDFKDAVDVCLPLLKAVDWDEYWDKFNNEVMQIPITFKLKDFRPVLWDPGKFKKGIGSIILAGDTSLFSSSKVEAWLEWEQTCFLKYAWVLDKFKTKLWKIETTKEEYASFYKNLTYDRREHLSVKHLSVESLKKSEEVASATVRKVDYMVVYTFDLVEAVHQATGNLEEPLEGFPIVVDAGNGAEGFFWRKVLEPLGAIISCNQFLEPDGMLPNHIPNPEDKNAMKTIPQAVQETKADLSIIFDKDVDKAAAVDSSGREFNLNRPIALMPAIALEQHPGIQLLSITHSQISIKMISAATNLEEALKGTLTVRPFPLGTSFSSKMEKHCTHFLGEKIASNEEVKSRLEKFWLEETGVPGISSFQEWLEISVVLWQTDVIHRECGQVIPTTRRNLYAFQLTAKPSLEPISSKHATVIPCLDEPDASTICMVWDPGPTSVQVINIHVITTLVQPQDTTMKVEAMKSLVAIFRSVGHCMNKQFRIPDANSLKNPAAVMGNDEGGNDLSDVGTESAELTQATKIEKDGFMVWDPGIGH